jgi:hypothetical protein
MKTIFTSHESASKREAVGLMELLWIEDLCALLGIRSIAKDLEDRLAVLFRQK